MKKKHIIIAALCAVVLAGATVGAVYALDSTDSTDNAAPGAPVETGGTPLEVAPPIGDTYMLGNDVYYYTEEEKISIREERTISNAIVAAMAENEHYKDSSRNPDNISFYAIQDCKGMTTQEQIRTYVDRVGQTKKTSCGNYARIRAEILGEMSADDARLTVGKLDGIVRRSASCDDLLNKLSEQYGTCDYTHYLMNMPGSNVEYWLDDKGTEYILIRMNGDGKISWICLGRANDPNLTELYSNEQLDAIFAAAK